MVSQFIYSNANIRLLIHGEATTHPQVQLCTRKCKPTKKLFLFETFSCLKYEESGGVHSQFQALLAAVSEPSPGCFLTTANRLFGEITYPFFQVSGCTVHFSSPEIYWETLTVQAVQMHTHYFLKKPDLRCL